MKYLVYFFSLFIFLYGELALSENPEEEVKRSLRKLQEEKEILLSYADVFHMQILRRDDAFSAPPMESKIDAVIERIDAIDKSLAYLNKLHGTHYDPSQVRIPKLHEDVVVRLNHYRNKIGMTLREFVHGKSPMNINFQSITPAPPGFSSFSGYPTEPIRRNSAYRCTTGGFMSSSVKPRNYPNFDSLPHRIEFSKDYICKTPKKVQLSLDGKPITLQCGPPKIKDRNMRTTFEQMDMCDPLLYGFFPFRENSPSTAIAPCSLPKQFTMGRETSYSENMASNQKVSHCDILAQRVSETLRPLHPTLQGQDLSLFLAAKLARENPELWAQKIERINETCQNFTTQALIENHCSNLKSRIKKIEKTLLESSQEERSDNLDHFQSFQ